MRIPRKACRVRCSFSTSANRTNSSPPSPKPIPGDPATFYFGGADGGVWKTIDAGVTWHPIFERGRSASIGAMAIAPDDRLLAYVEDTVGRRQYGLGIKNLETGETLPDRIEDVAAARFVYAKAEASGVGTWVELGGTRDVPR